ncbi:hypothetical protein AGLY_002918 [Aphis glycines]|uniref:BRCT domain-containing protein n=1 Tax=Aphis glycines TaxID=307491 RepID=A0A6G0U221_APHGL|nr:hypothetical protein AGLY_002918 [Aphis glycines]
MSKHLVDMASKQKDVMFNMLSLKHKLLIPEKECEKCEQHTKDWLIINVCHHVLCINCANIHDDINYCQICNITFDPNTQVSTVTEMKIAFSQVEDLVWKVIALESGTLDELYPDEEFNKKKKPDMNHINSIKSSMQNHLSSQNNESNEESNLNLSQSSVDLFEETEDIEVQEQENDCIQSNRSISICVKSDKNNELAASVPDIVAEWDTDSDSETIILSDLPYRSSTIISADVDFQYQDQNMNGDNGICVQNATDSSNSGSESEDDVVRGTPDRCHVSNPWNHATRNRHIVITYTNVENKELEVIRDLVDMFKLNVSISWTDKVTHLILKTNADKRCIRTKKFMNALLLNCFIISLEWAKDCITSKTLLPEVDYIPPEFCGEFSPLASWRVGRGIINSPMEWTNNCILYFHSSIEFNDSYSDIKLWARKAGFVLANDLGDFNDNYTLRIILADKISSSHDVRANLPNKREITGWICDNKGVAIYLDWLLECLFRYRFVTINHHYQIMKLNSNLVEYVNMNQGLFEFEFK